MICAAFCLALAASPLGPTDPTVKDVVFTLIRGGDDLEVFEERNKCLRAALAGSKPYDSVAFHEGNVPDAAQRGLIAQNPRLRFVDVKDAFESVPSHVTLPDAVVKGEVEGSVAYRHMCNFMATRWYRELANYEYAMRVDEDVCVQNFKTNPFDAMRERDLVYSYGLKTFESHYETVLTMPPWVRKFAAQEGLTAPAPYPDELVRADRTPDRLPGQTIYFTNFFISRVGWWLRADVQKFLAAVDASGFIYLERWGDAPIQTAALQLYAPTEAVSRLSMSYLHASTLDEIHEDGSWSAGWEDKKMMAHPLTKAYRRQLRRRLNLGFGCCYETMIIAGGDLGTAGSSAFCSTETNATCAGGIVRDCTTYGDAACTGLGLPTGTTGHVYEQNWHESCPIDCGCSNTTEWDGAECTATVVGETCGYTVVELTLDYSLPDEVSGSAYDTVNDAFNAFVAAAECDPLDLLAGWPTTYACSGDRLVRSYNPDGDLIDSYPDYPFSYDASAGVSREAWYGLIMQDWRDDNACVPEGSPLSPGEIDAYAVEIMFASDVEASMVTDEIIADMEAEFAAYFGVDPEDVTVTIIVAPLPGRRLASEGSHFQVVVKFPSQSQATAADLDAQANLGTQAEMDALLVGSGVTASADPTIQTTAVAYPPPSPEPSPPPPSPGPSYPPLPAPPPEVRNPEEYVNDSPGASPSAVMGIAIACILGTTIIAIGILFVTGAKEPLETGLVPQRRLGAGMLNWGFFVVKARMPICAGVLIFYLILAAVGCPKIKSEQGSSDKWVPSGSQLQTRIKDWNELVDDTVTDRTSATIMVYPEDGSNILDDPARWLDANLRIEKRVYERAVVESTDRDGNGLLLGWKDFCFSINHPMLVDEIPGISPGTAGNWKPCINPGPLDGFLEQTWEFNKSAPDTVNQEKYSSWAVINSVSVLACAISPPNCGQVVDPYSYPSFYNLSRAEIITRMMDNSFSVGHWISAASQPWGKLYGAFEGYNNGMKVNGTGAQCVDSRNERACNEAQYCVEDDCEWDRELSFVKSFVTTLFQDIPKEVIQFRASVQNMDADEFRAANKRWLKKIEDVLEDIDEDDDEFPGVTVTYYPDNALDRMYEEVAGAHVANIVIGYVVMLVFVCISQISRDRYKNLCVLGVLGFFFVLAGNAAAYGLIALAGHGFNATMTQALPFLALGLGVDDLFLLLHAYKGVMKHFRGGRREIIVALTMMEAGSSVTITSICNACVFFASYMIPIEALQAFSVSAGTIIVFNWITAMTLVPAMFSVWSAYFETPEGMNINISTSIETLEKHKRDRVDKTSWDPASLIERFYNFFSTSLPLKLAFLAIGVGVLIGFAVQIKDVDMGVKETDLAKRGSYLARGINDIWEDVYSQHLVEVVVFGVGVDYTKDQKVMLDTHQQLKDSKYCAYGTAYGRGGLIANTWLTNLYQAPGVCPYGPFGEGYTRAEMCPADPTSCDGGFYNDGTDPFFAFYDDFHLWRKPQVFLEPRFSPGANTLAFGSIFAGLLDRVNQWPYSKGADNYDVDNILLLSWDEVELNMKQLDTTAKKIDMVKDYRAICEASGLNIYMFGWTFIQLEQLLDLEYYFWQAVAVCMAVVFVVSLLFGMSWINACLISFFSVILCVEVYGSLKMWNITFQNLAATSMLMSIGIAVEFVAHPVARYEFAVGTRNERLADAMAATALPVAEGALSSFLGFCFLATSEFAFVTKYFFAIFFMICIFGTINALVFLPAVLGLFGRDKKNDDLHDGAKEAGKMSDRVEHSTSAGGRSPPKTKAAMAVEKDGQVKSSTV